MNQEIPWKKYTVEAFVIVASILLAFAIDAWWEERVERTQERILLQNLLEDFRDTRELLEVELPRYTQRKEWAQSVAEYGSSGGYIQRPEILNEPLRLVTLWTALITTYPKTDTLDGAFASGRLEIISNNQLRSILAGWPRVLREFSEQDAWLTNLIQESRPIIASSVPIASTVLSSPGINSEFAVVQKEGLTNQIIEFVMTDTGQNYMALYAQALAWAESDGAMLLSTVDEIISLLEQELG